MALYLLIPRFPDFGYQGGSSIRKKSVEDHSVKVFGSVISLKAMCGKWWLEKVQFCLRRHTAKTKVLALHKYLADLPREIRSGIVHNALKSGGLHLAHGCKEIASVNMALVFLSSDMAVRETVYVTIPRSGPDGQESPSDLDLVIRSGEGLLNMIITLPVYFSDSVKRCLSDICRTCRRLISVTLHEGCDDAVTLITRYCQSIQKLDLSGSQAVTDVGIARAIVNLKWSPESQSSSIQYFDVGHTSVTEEGVLQLLTRLPSITSFGTRDILDSLEGINLLSGEYSVTAIEEITMKCATVNRILTVRKCCPNLRSINVTFQENPGASLNDLRLLSGLKDIKISVREPFLLTQAHVYDLTWAIGSSLESLKVSGDVYWEADLGTIGGQCPNLRYLAFPAITLPTKQSLQVLQAANTPTLIHLVELELDCMSGIGPKAWAKDFNLVRQALVVLLRRTRRLRRLVLRPTCLVDTDFLEILNQNRLVNLEVVELYNCGMGLTCAKLIVDTCNNLHVMKGLRTWRGMTLHDLVLLRKHSRGHRRESDLKIVP